MTKKDRLKEAFEYLKSKGIVHTQKDVANRMKTTPPNVSSAFRGDERVLTDSFIERFANAFGNISYYWLLTGNGEMIVANNITQVATGNSGNVTQNAGSGNTSTNTTTTTTTHNCSDYPNDRVNEGQLIISKILDEVAAQRKMTEKAMTQIDRLVDIIESMNKYNKE